MSEDEIMVFIVSAGLAVFGAAKYRTGRLPGLVRRDNPGLGLIRLAVLAGMGWLVYVLARHADPSVQGVYNVFYLVMGYAALQCFGKGGAHLFGAHARIDAGERKNWAAALFVAGFTLGTGLIFGASLWGEADPTGDGEGGWWIPLGFFLLGWSVMAGGLTLYCWREPGSFRKRIRQERDAGTALGAASFAISASVLMVSAVSGDFWGWTHGLKDVMLAAGLLIVHEFIHLPDRLTDRIPALRWIESGIYFGVVAVNLLIQWLR